MKAVELLTRALPKLKGDLARDVKEYLAGNAKCEAKECSYYRFYLAYGPAELTHEGYHSAEKHCQHAQERIDVWLKSHPTGQIPLALSEQAHTWEKRIRA